MRQKLKAYHKPVIAKIDLKGEEVFLTACKLASGSVSVRARTVTCSTSTRCSRTRSPS